tara:strand:+ start:242 stop:538 length:297 start_codon:yes stop_codon:yes gene_type:complete
MKITKRQLRRIIKEEKTRLLKEMNPAVEEGISRGVQNGVWNWIEEEFSQDMIGEDVWSNPTYVESIAHALEAVAREVRQSKTIPPEEHHTSPATRNRR